MDQLVKVYDNNFCPFCESENTEGIEKFEVDTNAAEQKCLCNDCGRTWHDAYAFTGIFFHDFTGKLHSVDVEPQQERKGKHMRTIINNMIYDTNNAKLISTMLIDDPQYLNYQGQHQNLPYPAFKIPQIRMALWKTEKGNYFAEIGHKLTPFQAPQLALNWAIQNNLPIEDIESEFKQYLQEA